jgi:hypothetical protein
VVVLGYVVVGGDYDSMKLLKVEQVDLIADDPGLQVYYQTVLGSCCRIVSRTSVDPGYSSRISCFSVRTHPHAAGRSA